MDEGTRPIRIGCLASSLLIMAAAVGFAVWINLEASLTAWGKEHPPQVHEPRLGQDLESLFRWDGLPKNSLEKVWINGFQDHTYLYRIRLSPEQFTPLRRAILSGAPEGVQLEDGDVLASCPFGFGTSRPQGPEEMKVPDWWDVWSVPTSLDGLLWKSDGRGYWFCYDRGREILFLLRYNG